MSSVVAPWAFMTAINRTGIRAFEHRFTAEHTFGPMNEILSFATSIGTGRELFPCARDVDNQIVVCPDRLGARIFVDGVEEAFSAVGRKDRPDAVPKLQTKQIVISDRAASVTGKAASDDPFIDGIVDRLDADLTHGADVRIIGLTPDRHTVQKIHASCFH